MHRNMIPSYIDNINIDIFRTQYDIVKFIKSDFIRSHYEIFVRVCLRLSSIIIIYIKYI